MAAAAAPTYSSTVETGIDELQMNLQLGLRTLALLGIVAACVAVLATPELVHAPGSAAGPAAVSMLVVGRN